MKNIVVNGIGAVGKRIAHAIKVQDDLTLYGIADIEPTSVLRDNLEGPLKGTDVYSSTQDSISEFEESNVKVSGTLPEILESGEVDLVVDATPSGIDEKNKKMYKKHGVKAIFQGGASSDIADVSFNSLANYYDAVDEQFVRVVSCNTTSLSRLLYTLNKQYGIEKAVASLVRRAGDPPQDSRGPVNSIIPVPHIPSHHGPDLQEVMPEIDITTMAVKVPTTLSHLHMLNIDLAKKTTEKEVKELLKSTPRIRLFKASEGYSSTAKIIEKFRDTRLRSDMPEVAVWEETIKVENNKLYIINQVHQESIIAPENVDAIRAMFDMEGKWDSIKKTNENMGLE